MPKISVNILTYNRPWQLELALKSVVAQTYRDFEVVAVNNGSTDNTAQVLESFKSRLDLKIISLPISLGITVARQKALSASLGEYIAVLDDDDEWLDPDKLKKQAEFLDAHPQVVLAGGGINAHGVKLRPESDAAIRKTMLLRNNFFTSTVMFRHSAALKAGGFIKDDTDVAEDYDLWLRLGRLGKMYNFQQVFTRYLIPNYNKERFKAFLNKQLRLIEREKSHYTGFLLGWIILKIRLFF